MSDIFSEVDDDLRRDTFLKLWKQYGIYLIIAAGLIIVGTAAWRGYLTYTEVQANAGADRFLAAVELANKDKAKDAIAALEDAAKAGPSGYSVLSRLRQASEQQKSGDNRAALATLDALSSDSNAPLAVQEFALVRAAAVAVDLGDLKGVEQRVGRFNDPGSSWRNAARELIALAAFKAKDYAKVRSVILPVTVDFQASQDTKGRAQLLLALADAALGPEAKPEVTPPVKVEPTTGTAK